MLLDCRFGRVRAQEENIELPCLHGDMYLADKRLRHPSKWPNKPARHPQTTIWRYRDCPACFDKCPFPHCRVCRRKRGEVSNNPDYRFGCCLKTVLPANMTPILISCLCDTPPKVFKLKSTSAESFALALSSL